MTVTEKLLKVFLVDKQLRGLESRLRAAERFLGEQSGQIGTLTGKRDAIDAQLRQLNAKIGDHEGEIARFDERIATLREQMNSARTNKEYKAFLTEVNTLKADRGREEESALELIAKREELGAQRTQVESQMGEREKMRGVAEGDRNARASEIRDRVAELRTQREALANEVPPNAMKDYEKLLEVHEDQAMAVIEVQDRRRHEFTCGACMMNLPIETVNGLLSHGNITHCVSCGVILYVDENVSNAVQPAGKR
ncbi:MAG: C4-type zinc ribbon domain-containing protein [Phycisphaerales bacterium]|jgi:predicted  nucleic acid-binding Zn-ribbon protein|nr:C4-type zinc ribbon domain-containing protein [Phycisphaerales bacterium]